MGWRGFCCCCRGCIAAPPAGDVGDAMLEAGVGVIDVNPTMPFRFTPWDPDTGLGAANCVFDVVLTVDDGGGMPNWFDDVDAAGAGAGVADWKSSKSSSSAPIG